MQKSPHNLEGRNIIHDALISDKNLTSIVVSKRSKKDPKVKEILKLAQKKKIPIKSVHPDYVRKISQTGNAQGMIAYMGIYELTSLEQILKNKLEKKETPLILLFNRLDYEQNLGAILRTSWGAKVDAVIVSPQGVHTVTPVVARASMGGSMHVPLISQSLYQALTSIKEFDIPVVGVEMGKGKVYSDITLLGPVAFVFGGEDAGLSEPLKKYCHLFVHIPMSGHLQSLNVSVATAVVLFEKLRQEREARKKC